MVVGGAVHGAADCCGVREGETGCGPDGSTGLLLCLHGLGESSGSSSSSLHAL